MSAKKHSLGEVVEVKEGAKVQRPNGEEHTVTGGSYVLDVPGIHVVDGNEMEVKDK